MRPGARLAAAVATAVALACLPASAQAQGAFYSGNQLWSRCSADNHYEMGVCMGFVMGVADAMAAGSAILGSRACLPQQSTGEQAQDVVMRYLEQHPEWRHQPAAGLVADALAEAFPCKP